MVKAFIFAGDQAQYDRFIRANDLHPNHYPRLGEYNWRGIRGADLIKIGTYHEDSRLMKQLPTIQQMLKGN